MKFKSILVKTIVPLILLISLSANQEDFPIIKGPYFGQKPPGMTPEAFTPALLSTNKHAFCSIFLSCGTELYFVSDIEGHDAADIMWTRRVDNIWTKPEVAPFNSPYNGTLYFPFRSKANVGESDIQRSPSMHGSFSKPINLGNSINTKYAEGDMCVAQDESFLVISCWRRPDNNGERDLYISFRNKIDGSWTKLINMGKIINNEHNENCPMISPDGKYFFFFRYDPTTKKAMTYWIDIKIIENLKPEGNI